MERGRLERSDFGPKNIHHLTTGEILRYYTLSQVTNTLTEIGRRMWNPLAIAQGFGSASLVISGCSLPKFGDTSPAIAGPSLNHEKDSNLRVILESTVIPTVEPSPEPSPTEEPTPVPTDTPEPTTKPTEPPTKEPSPLPTVRPSAATRPSMTPRPPATTRPSPEPTQLPPTIDPADYTPTPNPTSTKPPVPSATPTPSSTPRPPTSVPTETPKPTDNPLSQWPEGLRQMVAKLPLPEGIKLVRSSTPPPEEPGCTFACYRWQTREVWFIRSLGNETATLGHEVCHGNQQYTGMRYNPSTHDWFNTPEANDFIGALNNYLNYRRTNNITSPPLRLIDPNNPDNPQPFEAFPQVCAGWYLNFPNDLPVTSSLPYLKDFAAKWLPK